MNSLKNIPFSILDLVPVRQGHSHLEAMQESLAFAQYAESLGYNRYWISEHHNAASLVSSATTVLMGYLAQGTSKIRIGSGGVMLPNHAPLIVAEQIGTLATLYPGRIDLGLGRAPGTDMATSRALRRERTGSVEDFPNDIQELRFFLSDEGENAYVQAIPGAGTNVPIYLLGSSPFSAELAAPLGLPYVFASHFAPLQLMEAAEIYKKKFKPSPQCPKPYFMAGVNVVVADTDEEAEELATSGLQFAVDIVRNTRQPLKPAVKSMDGLWSDYERGRVEAMRTRAMVGSPETVKKKLEDFIAETGVNELITVAYIYDQEARKKSFKLLMDLKN